VQCPGVRPVGLVSYSPAIKLTERRKKAFLKELERHGILARAARAAGASHITQTVISRRTRALDDRPGQPLLRSIGYRIELANAAGDFLIGSRAALAVPRIALSPRSPGRLCCGDGRYRPHCGNASGWVLHCRVKAGCCVYEQHGH
jgi:hypothetical protein